MSVPRKRTVVCTQCGTLIDSWFWGSINLEKHPEAARKLENNDYFKAFCPSCGKVTIDPYSMICYDQSKGVFFEFWFNSDSHRLFYLDELLEEGQRCSVVSRIEDLAEKVLAYKNGRDDRIVEMCKYWMLLKFARYLNDFELQRLYYSVVDGEEKIVGIDTKGEKAVADFPQNVYRQFESAFKDILPTVRAKFDEYDIEWADSFIHEHIGMLLP